MRAFPEALLLGVALAIAVAGPERTVAQTRVPTQSIDPFGQEVMLAAKPILYIKGSTSPEEALDAAIAAFRKIDAYLAQAGLAASGPPMMIYTTENFDYEAAIPLAEPPKSPPGDDIAIGTSPAGKVLKFVHRGPFDELPQTYEAITNYLDGKGLDAGPPLIEEYVTDPATAAADQLVVNVYASIR
jgi:effector-binding domain-containing protein